MTSMHSLSSRLSGTLGAVLLGSLAACSHGGTGSAVAAGSGTVIVFSNADMSGDWVGQLVPDNATKPARNIYLRIENGVLVEAADSVKTTWYDTDSVFSLTLAQDGDLFTSMQNLSSNSEMVLDGTMSLDKESISGVYDYGGQTQLISSGTFTLTRSSGAGHFDLSQVAGSWDGFGYNKLSRTQDFTLQVDPATGQVISGAFIRHDGTIRHQYSAGSGTFSYFDDAVGRLEDVVLIADNGSMVTFEALLVDENGTLMGGPGHDTEMGSGVIFMERP